jgi:hypothetical protein
MTTNPYAEIPLYIAQVDPLTGRHVRAFYFLGAAPKAVLNAAKRARPSRADPRRPEWTAADAATLRGFYGVHWQNLLTPEDPPLPESFSFAQNIPADRRLAAFKFFGGAKEDLEFGNLDNIDIIRDESTSTIVEDPGRPNWSSSGVVVHTAGPPVYTDLAVYAEDTIYDLRLKLCVASGVSLYRQHFFYYINAEGPIVPYRFTLDGAPVLADWRALATADPIQSTTVIAGVTVDPQYEERRGGIQVEALDTFTLLSPVAGVQVTQAYFVDLFAVLPPMGSPERRNDSLATVLRDRYQFDLLYYGGLLRYWPQLSPDACSVALSNPAQFAISYPMLAPNLAALRARFENERAIADRALSWRQSAAKGVRQMTAVTTATVRVEPAAAKMRVAVRNVFDWIPTGLAVAAARARFDIDAGSLSDAGVAIAGPEARQGGLIPADATKRHASSFGPRAAPAINAFINRPARRNSVTYALAREGPSDEDFAQTSRQIPYVYLTVFADGRTEATADWREDDRTSFDAVTKEIAAVVGPIIDAINLMGAAAFPIGGTLAPPGRPAAANSSEFAPSLTTLGVITVSAFWPHALTAAAFREVKNRFRVYEKAGIVGIRGLQQAGAYTFTFRKGVVAYDPRLADRAEAGAYAARPGEAPPQQNQYAWLTDSGVAARWAAAFQGRMVRIYHRVTDLRVEVLGADSLAEFRVIHRYIFSFLDGLLTGPDKIRIGEAPRLQGNPKTKGSSRRLRRLQEHDPNLFDLKKYDQDATVYSVLCQSGRQPRIYREPELRTLKADQRAALVRYWNFTENEPAFYGCPNPKYPHLSFRAGKHPLGYCLPCCKKTRAAAGSRAALVNKDCLAQRTHTVAPEDKEELAMSRHVLTYGKAVPVGRISDLPREVCEGLFLDALPAPYRLQLVGVEQSAPAVPDAGFAYALAFAIGIGDDSIDEVLGELAALAATMGDTYYALGGGGGAAFASGQDLATAILNAFVRRDADLSPLGPGGIAADSWHSILADLARHAYGVEVVILADPDGAGVVSVEAAPDAVAAITSVNCQNASAPLRIALLSVGPAGTYPVAALNPKLFMKVAPASRWMVARRSFEFCNGRDSGDGADGDADGDAEAVIDRVADIIRGVIETNDSCGSHTEQGAAALDLGLITRWGSSTAPEPAFTVEARLANFHNMCYGVILHPREIFRGASANASRVYIPIRLSAYPVDGMPVVFGPRPAAVLPAATLTAAVADLNRYIVAAREPYAPVVCAATIVNASGQTVGFVTPGSSPLHFFHDPEPGPRGPDFIRFPYDSREVDLAIADSLRRGYEKDTEVDLRAAEANVQNQLYRLFLAEFSAVLRAERNEPLRGQLMAALKSTRYESAKSVAALRHRLVEILHNYPDDLQVVRQAVARAYALAPQNPGESVRMAVAATSFTFDRQSMGRLREGSHGDAVRNLRALMAPRVTDATTAGVNMEGRAIANMYVSCAEESAVNVGDPSGMCFKRRLVVPADRLEDFYDILAADVRNPGKMELLAAISAGVLDSLDFIRRPGEHLDISLGGR